MNKEQIINYIISNNIVENQLKFICNDSNYFDDILQEIYLIILEYDEQKLINAYEHGYINAFISSICRKMYNSKTSKFYYKYKRYDKNRLPLTDVKDK